MDVYYIVTDKCTECTGFHDEPQCAAVCPVDCCVDDPDHTLKHNDGHAGFLGQPFNAEAAKAMADVKARLDEEAANVA